MTQPQEARWQHRHHLSVQAAQQTPTEGTHTPSWWGRAGLQQSPRGGGTAAASSGVQAPPGTIVTTTVMAAKDA